MLVSLHKNHKDRFQGCAKAFILFLQEDSLLTIWIMHQPNFLLNLPFYFVLSNSRFLRERGGYFLTGRPHTGHGTTKFDPLEGPLFKK